MCFIFDCAGYLLLFVQAFSSCSKRGLLASCDGFLRCSCGGYWLLAMASLVAEQQGL